MKNSRFKNYLSKTLNERGIEIPLYAGAGAMALGAAALYPESPEYILMGAASALCVVAGKCLGYWWRKSGFDKNIQL